MENYDKAFEKVAWTLSFRGYTGNNWFAAESSTLVAAALSLQDAQKRNFIWILFEPDTVVDGCGQLSLPSASKLWFTPDGHWKEPGGYHNYPVSKLIEAALMLEIMAIRF